MPWIRCGLSLSRSEELTAQWTGFLLLVLCILSPLDDLSAVRGLEIGDFHRIFLMFIVVLCDFIHAIVVHRRE